MFEKKILRFYLKIKFITPQGNLKRTKKKYWEVQIENLMKLFKSYYFNRLKIKI